MEELRTLGLVVQGGSFALLAFVVYWLTRWVPKRIEDADRTRQVEAAAHKDAVTAVVAGAAEQARYEREACERRQTEIVSHLDRQYEVLREVRHGVADIQHSRALERAAREQAEQQQQKEKGGAA